MIAGMPGHRNFYQLIFLGVVIAGLFAGAGCQPTARPGVAPKGRQPSVTDATAPQADISSNDAASDQPHPGTKQADAVATQGQGRGASEATGAPEGNAEHKLRADASATADRAIDADEPSLPSATAHLQNHEERSDASEPLFQGWTDPLFVIVVSGRQNGYLEPCGCTGLANQKGGLARRFSLFEHLRGRGWPLIPIDLGNQVRRFGRQPELQFQMTTEALRKMGYEAVTFGPADLQLSVDVLAATTATTSGDSEPMLRFLSANVAILDRQFTPRYRLLTVAGKRVAVVGVLGDQYTRDLQVSEVLIEPAREGLRRAWAEIEAAGGCDYALLLAHATRGETITLAQTVPHFDIVVTAGGGDVPPHQMETIDGTRSLLFWVGAKGMYVGVVGFFPGQTPPWQFQRVPLDKRFPDSRIALDLMASYQRQLERLGFDGLGLKPLPHPSGREFVGSAVCGDCHTKAYAVWKDTPHAHATDSIVHPTERSEIPRHFDPECVSCHATGWEPQRFRPYASGYWSLATTPRMVGNGCENCHGPGSAHVAAEEGGADDETLLRLRREMRLPLDEAEKKCVECHDLDNSPDFHLPGAFQRYWQRIAHPGKD